LTWPGLCWFTANMKSSLRSLTALSLLASYFASLEQSHSERWTRFCSPVYNLCDVIPNKESTRCFVNVTLLEFCSYALPRHEQDALCSESVVRCC
jgi:hypothetical protein